MLQKWGLLSEAPFFVLSHPAPPTVCASDFSVRFDWGKRIQKVYQYPA